MQYIPGNEDEHAHITDENGITAAIFKTIESNETGRLFAAASELLAACEAYMAVERLADPGAYLRGLDALKQTMAAAIRKATSSQ